MKVFYHGIIKVAETPHLFIMATPMYTVFMIDKSRFSKGEAEQFLAFLKKRCTKAKFKDATQANYDLTTKKQKK